MGDKTKVSVVTAVYNGEEYLNRCIGSIKKQRYENIEYIVIDGGSTDGSIGIIEQHEEVIDCWVSEPDDGVYDAMNKGIRRATGDVIGLLNADDYYEEHTAQIVAETYEKNPDSIIVGAMNRILQDESTYTLRRKLSQRVLDSEIYYRTPVNHPATFVPASVYDRIGLFDPSIKICSDYDLICRAYQAGVPFVFVDRVLSNMQAGGMSSGTNNALLRAQEFYEIRSKNNLVSPARNLWLSTWWFLATMAKEGIKNLLPGALNARLYRARHGTPSKHP
jgi:glycosyltransferase involved in cell wall biosynthesis